MNAEENSVERKEKDAYSKIFFVLFGVYLLIGAGFTAYQGKWFGGFPPQFDFAYFIFGASTTGAYVSAAIAALIGALIIWAALSERKENAS